ncbi:MAG: ATP-grasp domain-containing protein [Pirellulaceae bacterium]|nr:ATP-grasp domain-containing protein [Pirellulaceae bacterium]
MSDRVGLIGISVRAAAEALGPKVIERVWDLYCDWDTEQAAPNRCDRLSLAGIVNSLTAPNRKPMAWLTTGGLDLEPAVLAALQTHPNRLLGLSLDSVRYCKNPAQWCDKLRHAGLAILPIEYRALCPPGHWHLKRNWPQSAPTWFWQQHGDGTLGSAIFLAQGSGVELVGCSRLFVRPDWRYQGNAADRSWPNEEAKKTLLRIATVLAEDIQPRGLFGIDFMLGQQLWPLEINPRPTASVEVLAELHRRNLFQEHVRACWPTAGGFATNDRAADLHLSKTSEVRLSAKRIVYNSEQEFSITDDRFQQFQQCSTFQPIAHPIKTFASGTFRLADLPHPGTIVPPREPICSILYHLPAITAEPVPTVEEIWTELAALEDHLLH